MLTLSAKQPIQAPTMSQIHHQFTDLILKSEFSITRQLFNQINDEKPQKNKVSLVTQLNVKNYFTRFLKQVSSLVNFAQDIYKQAKVIKLMKNGQYLMEVITGKQQNFYLIFSQFAITYVQQNTKKDQKSKYYGFKYKLNKYAYIGNFKVDKNSLVFHNKGELKQIVKKEQSNQYWKSKGNWKNGIIIQGTRTIYSNQNEDDKNMIQQYTGKFYQNRYEGQGVIKLKDSKDKLYTREGNFANGVLIIQNINKTV